MGKYVIRKLPEISIINGELKKGMFPEVRYTAKIRPRACNFACCSFFSPNFIIIYCDDFGMAWCDFILRYENTPVVCRCVGKRGVRNHWKNVIPFINSHKDEILALSDKEYISFS